MFILVLNCEVLSASLDGLGAMLYKCYVLLLLKRTVIQTNTGTVLKTALNFCEMGSSAYGLFQAH